MISSKGFTQISAPGMGDSKTGAWIAVGVKQDLGTKKLWQSMSYAGLGRKSETTNLNPLAKAAIVIVNQEFYRQLGNHFQASLAVSYRRQNLYNDEENGVEETTKLGIQQEARLYSRLSYTIQTNKIKFVPTIRQEIRKFYSPDKVQSAEDFQLRSRIRLQLILFLNNNKSSSLTLANEQLFASSKDLLSNKFDTFSYRESRFSLYYSLSPKDLPLTFSLGYMNNLVSGKSAHYMAFDVVIKNPFGGAKKKGG